MKRSPIFTIVALSCVLALVGCGASTPNTKQGHSNNSFSIAGSSGSSSKPFSSSFTAGLVKSDSSDLQVNYYGVAPKLSLSAADNSGVTIAPKKVSSSEKPLNNTFSNQQKTEIYTVTFTPTISTPISSAATINIHQDDSNTADNAVQITLNNSKGSFSAKTDSDSLSAYYDKSGEDNLTVTYSGQKPEVKLSNGDGVVSLAPTVAKTKDISTDTFGDGMQTDKYIISFKPTSTTTSMHGTADIVITQPDSKTEPFKKDISYTQKQSDFTTTLSDKTPKPLLADINGLDQFTFEVSYSGFPAPIATLPGLVANSGITLNKTDTKTVTTGDETTDTWTVSYTPTSLTSSPETAAIKIHQDVSASTINDNTYNFSTSVYTGNHFYLASVNHVLQKLGINGKWIDSQSADSASLIPQQEDKSFYSLGGSGYVAGYNTSSSEKVSPANNNGYFINGVKDKLDQQDADDGKPYITESLINVDQAAQGDGNAPVVFSLVTDNSSLAPDAKTVKQWIIEYKKVGGKITQTKSELKLTKSGKDEIIPASYHDFEINTAEADPKSESTYNMLLTAYAGNAYHHLWCSYTGSATMSCDDVPKVSLTSDASKYYNFTRVNAIKGNEKQLVNYTLNLYNYAEVTDAQFYGTAYDSASRKDQGYVLFQQSAPVLALANYQTINCSTAANQYGVPDACYLSGVDTTGKIINYAKIIKDHVQGVVTIETLTAGTIPLTESLGNQAAAASTAAPKTQVNGDTGDMMVVSADGKIYKANLTDATPALTPISGPSSGTPYAVYQD